MNSDAQKYRIVRDHDQRILGYRPMRKGIVLLAEEMAHHFNCAVLIQQRSRRDGEYSNLARLDYF